jgi:2-polyprenyl-3-methyl-5-hydroxy-6-metoxy-1,4-benzoquinol methylase
VFDEDYLRILPPLDDRQVDRELRFVLDGMAVAKGARLLDLGCGHGLLATSLQARGFDVVGLDSSMTMLTVATEEARRRGLGPSFVHGDMRALALDGEFDGVLCIHGTFGYFEDEENGRILASVFRALRPGGKFVLSVPNRDYFVADLPARICWEAHGSMVLDEVDFDFLRSRLEVRRSIAFEEGRQVEHRYSVRVYAMHEITALLEKAGFTVTSASGSIATPGTFLGPYSRSLWLFAQKP